MPIVPIAIAFGVGLFAGGSGGFLAGDGIKGLSSFGRVVVAGAAVFVAAKAFKVI